MGIGGVPTVTVMVLGHGIFTADNKNTNNKGQS